MAYMERVTQQILPGKWPELEQWEKKWDELEARLGGYPKKRRYRPYVGGDGWMTFIWEREWESLAAMEAAETRLFTEPEARALAGEWDTMVSNMKREYCFILEW